MEGSDREQDRYRTDSDREREKKKGGEREKKKDRLEKTQRQNSEWQSASINET